MLVWLSADAVLGAVVDVVVVAVVDVLGGVVCVSFDALDVLLVCVC